MLLQPTVDLEKKRFNQFIRPVHPMCLISIDDFSKMKIEYVKSKFHATAITVAIPSSIDKRSTAKETPTAHATY